MFYCVSSPEFFVLCTAALMWLLSEINVCATYIVTSGPNYTVKKQKLMMMMIINVLFQL